MSFRSFFGILATDHYTGDGSNPQIRSEHPGWELLAPLPQLDRRAWARPQKFSQLQVHGQTHTIYPTSALLYNGRDRHISIHRGEFRYHALMIAEGFLNEILEPVNLLASDLVFDEVEFTLQAQESVRLQELVGLANVPEVSRATVESLVTEFVVDHLLRRPTTASAKLKSAAGTGHYPAVMHKAKRCLLENIVAETFDLEQLSQDVGLSRFHLIRTFRQNIGCTPMQYRNLLRNDLAKRQLLQTGVSILELSAALGFKDLSTFNKSFKRHNRASPTAFRRQHQSP